MDHIMRNEFNVSAHDDVIMYFYQLGIQGQHVRLKHNVVPILRKKIMLVCILFFLGALPQSKKTSIAQFCQAFPLCCLSFVYGAYRLKSLGAVRSQLVFRSLIPQISKRYFRLAYLTDLTQYRRPRCIILIQL